MIVLEKSQMSSNYRKGVPSIYSNARSTCRLGLISRVHGNLGKPLRDVRCATREACLGLSPARFCVNTRGPLPLHAVHDAPGSPETARRWERWVEFSRMHCKKLRCAPAHFVSRFPLSAFRFSFHLFLSNHAFTSRSSDFKSGRFAAITSDSCHSCFKSPNSTLEPTRMKIGI